MLFEDAFKAMREGKKIRKTTWNPKQFLQIKDQYVRTAFGDIYNINNIYFLDDDWDIVEEPRKRHARMYIDRISGGVDTSWKYVDEEDRLHRNWIGEWVDIPDEIPS